MKTSQARDTYTYMHICMDTNVSQATTAAGRCVSLQFSFTCREGRGRWM